MWIIFINDNKIANLLHKFFVTQVCWGNHLGKLHPCSWSRHYAPSNYYLETEAATYTVYENKYNGIVIHTYMYVSILNYDA